MFNRRGFNNLSAVVGRFSRKFGGSSHGHGDGHAQELHVPEFHAKLAKALLLTTYLWILYRFKEDRGQILGLYKPWLHEHKHVHYHYKKSGVEGDAMPVLVDDDEDENEDEHEDGHEDEHEDEEDE